MSHEWPPPGWMFRDRKPHDDSAYFENLTRCVFQAGLSWRTITGKWPNFRAAFDSFDIEAIASYGEEDVERLVKDAGIIRNRRKILATIHNAGEFGRIAEEHGSFQAWLDGLDKSENHAGVVKLLASRMKHVGWSTAHVFLYSVGENIKYERAPSGPTDDGEPIANSFFSATDKSDMLQTPSVRRTHDLPRGS